MTRSPLNTDVSHLSPTGPSGLVDEHHSLLDDRYLGLLGARVAPNIS